MFGMGFMEIMLIAVIAIVALGPDKLPNAMVEIAKFIKKFKSGVDEAKTTLDSELNLKEMKEEAQMFKAQIENTKSSMKFDNHVDLGLDKIMDDDLEISKKDEETKQIKTSENQKVSFKKKKKEKEPKEKKSIEDSNEEIVQNTANKFKVNFPEESDKQKDEKKEDNA